MGSGQATASDRHRRAAAQRGSCGPTCSRPTASSNAPTAAGCEGSPNSRRCRRCRNPRPVHAEPVAGQGNPLFIHAYADWRETLEVLRRSEPPHAHDAYLMEFTNPVDGGSMMTTISAFARLVPAGFETRAARSSDGMINVVVEGTGTLFIDGEPFALAPGEIVVVPSWSERRCRAESDLVLFSYSDRATQQKLSLWRERLG